MAKYFVGACRLSVCSLPPLPVIQTVIKYLVNLLWINVNQIECEYFTHSNKFKGKQQRYPLLDHHGLLNLLSAATSLQVLPTGLILPPEHLDSNHHRYKSFMLRGCVGLGKQRRNACHRYTYNALLWFLVGKTELYDRGWAEQEPRISIPVPAVPVPEYWAGKKLESL